MGARFLTVGIRSCKYTQEKNKNELYTVVLRLEILVCMMFFIYLYLSIYPLKRYEDRNKYRKGCVCVFLNFSQREG